VRTDITIRRITLDDVDIVATHRSSMVVDMGRIDHSLVPAMESQTRTFLHRTIPSGEYVGWVAVASEAPHPVIAGVGAQLGRVQPYVTRAPDATPMVGDGRQALVVNVYTRPEWRGRGVARALMQALLDWTNDEGILRVILHASADGRPLYESLGFVATNEMRLER
jgi:GNAT superfamily N-acetyltransferase